MRMRCKKCDRDIEEGERYFTTEDGDICEDCFVEYAIQIVQDDIEHTAEALDIPWNYNSNSFEWDDDRDRRDY